MILVAIVATICSIPSQVGYIQGQARHRRLMNAMAGAADTYAQIADIPDTWADPFREVAREFSGWWGERLREAADGQEYDPAKHEAYRRAMIERTWRPNGEFRELLLRLSQDPHRWSFPPRFFPEYSPLFLWASALGPTFAVIVLLAWVCRPAPRVRTREPAEPVAPSTAAP
jgi:hypothetical protein